MEYTTFDANINEITTEKPVDFKRLSDDLRYLVPNFYDFRVIRDLDTIEMRFTSVNHFQSYKNIKNHFLKLREVIKSPINLLKTLFWIVKIYLI